MVEVQRKLALPNAQADLEPFSEECEEHGEVDGAGGLVHHRLQVLVSRVLHIGSLCLKTKNSTKRSLLDPDPQVFGLLDPAPLAGGTDPDPSMIKQNSYKNLYFYRFVTYL